MKRLVQFVAAGVIGLMTLQPVLGAEPCATTAPAACTASCPMASAGPICPMAQSPMMGCTSGCCELSHSRTVAAVAVLAKPKAAMSGGVTVVPVTAVQASAAQPKGPSRSVPVTSPPRYKLFRVFRI